MASQPSVTSVVQKRGARLPKEKSDVGETPLPCQKYIQEGLDQSCCRLGFSKLCRLDPLTLDPALSWMKPTPGVMPLYCSILPLTADSPDPLISPGSPLVVQWDRYPSKRG